MTNSSAPLAVIFHRLGPYHHARLSAAAKRLEIAAVELSAVDHTYRWEQVEGMAPFRKATLFEESDIDAESTPKVFQRVCDALDACRPKAVAIPGWSHRGPLAALWWCLLTHTPAIVMSESSAHDEPRRAWKEAVKSRTVRLFAAGLVGGEPHAAYLEALGFPRQSIFKGYDVVDNDHFARGADATRRDGSLRNRLGLPEQFFLASCRFVPKKNLPALLCAYKGYLDQAGSDAWSLVVLGDGPMKPALARLIERLDLTERVVLPGFQQYHELPNYYGLAGAFLHASSTEQWGLVVNEAMAAGLPVLVSGRCGCAADLVKEGENGFTFDPYDAPALTRLMLKLTGGGLDLAAMGWKSRELIRAWTPELFAEGLRRATAHVLHAGNESAGWLEKSLVWTLAHR